MVVLLLLERKVTTAVEWTRAGVPLGSAQVAELVMTIATVQKISGGNEYQAKKASTNVIWLQASINSMI